LTLIIDRKEENSLQEKNYLEITI